MNSNYQKLLVEFLGKSNNFEKDINLEIDTKHNKIVNDANNLIQNKKSHFIKNFRDWSGQSDLDCPNQLTFLHLRKFGFFFFIFFFKKNYFFLEI